METVILQAGVDAAQANTDALVAAIKLRRGVRLPWGRYYINPIGKAQLGIDDTRGWNMVGDGISGTELRLPPVDGHTEPMFDLDGLSFFDVTWTGFRLHGWKTSAPVVRLNSGGRHYRVSFRDVWIHSGRVCLSITQTQRIILDGVTLTKGAERGLELRGPLGVFASGLDIEQCNTGVFIDDGGMHFRRHPAVSIEQFYVERNRLDAHLSGVHGCKISCSAYKAKVRFSRGSKHNMIFSTDVRIIGDQGPNHVIG